jgi:hypothetical protein
VLLWTPFHSRAYAHVFIAARPAIAALQTWAAFEAFTKIWEHYRESEAVQRRIRILAISASAAVCLALLPAEFGGVRPEWAPVQLSIMFQRYVSSALAIFLLIAWQHSCRKIIMHMRGNVCLNTWVLGAWFALQAGFCIVIDLVRHRNGYTNDILSLFYLVSLLALFLNWGIRFNRLGEMMPSVPPPTDEDLRYLEEYREMAEALEELRTRERHNH